MDAAIGNLMPPMTRERPRQDSVQPAAPVSSAPAETSRPEVSANAERSVERDMATGSLVYRLIDVSTGFVAVQTPSEARLRLRAYIDGVMKSSAPDPAVEVTA